LSELLDVEGAVEVVVAGAAVAVAGLLSVVAVALVSLLVAESPDAAGAFAPPFDE